MPPDMLLHVLTPPQEPIEPGNTEAWGKIEQDLQTPLPQDYKDYICRFGSGRVGSFLWPANPFSTKPYLTLQKHVAGNLRALRELKEEFGDEVCPYPLFPEPGGLMPWGHTDNGDVLFWLTTGGPEQWPVVINESRGPEFELHPMSMTSFLANLLTGALRSDILPVSFIAENAGFEPVK